MRNVNVLVQYRSKSLQKGVNGPRNFADIQHFAVMEDVKNSGSLECDVCRNGFFGKQAQGHTIYMRWWSWTRLPSDEHPQTGYFLMSAYSRSCAL
jgi:hypothetical protein